MIWLALGSVVAVLAAIYGLVRWHAHLDKEWEDAFRLQDDESPWN